MYEQRIAQLGAEYKDRGASVVTIEPNDPKAISIDELDSSDISDSLEEMKIRAEYKHLTYPYLYDGETQSVSNAYGPQATPHAFVFDRDRRLRTSRNLLFDSNDTASLQTAFDSAWESAVPYTVLIAPAGKVLYRRQGSIDILELRRTILANLPSDYEGFSRYWAEQ